MGNFWQDIKQLVQRVLALNLYFSYRVFISTSPDFAREVYERLFRPDLTTHSHLLSL